jgi:hypothetical protein
METEIKTDGPPSDEATPEDNVTITLRGPDGEVKQEEKLHNLIVTAGRDAIVDRLASGTAVPTHMAVGTGGTAPVAGNTTLQTELDRNALTSKNAANGVLTMVGDWAAGDATGAITEAGIFSASSGGTMFARATFSVINKAAGDTLSITWTFTLSVT